MQSHSESSDNTSIISSTTIAASDCISGLSTTTLVPEIPPKSPKNGSKSKDTGKKDGKNKKGGEPLPRVLRPPMIFA